ncbi:conserved domain [Brachionus plicatilis]|uniref:Conserved domain n=1 Tax=Brachionus plicatilis TaxID=10195 RepID=A0A3M7PD99_BRAPC|nr:conserved domain [Brachionus plicatilis]
MLVKMEKFPLFLTPNMREKTRRVIFFPRKKNSISVCVQKTNLFLSLPLIDQARIQLKEEWINIMDNSNYTEDIKQMLLLENKFILKLIDSKKYKRIIEIGCGFGENAFDFAMHYSEIEYIGMDVNHQYISKAKLMAEFKDIKNLHFNKLAANEIEKIFSKLNDLKEKKTLIYFPFNILGNITNINETILKIYEYECDFIIFTYQQNEKANQERQIYYTNCGFKLEFKENLFFSCFSSSNGFVSKVYKKIFMDELLKDETKSYNKFEECLGSIGYIYLMEKKH